MPLRHFPVLQTCVRAGGVVVASIFLSVFEVEADVLVLANGERMEGVIVGETDGKVSVDVGMGAISISTSRIVEILRAGEDENLALQAAWKKRYAPPLPLPDEWLPLSRTYGQLSGLRQKAIRASRSVKTEGKRSETLRRREQVEVDTYNRLNAALAALNPSENRRRYNELVDEFNPSVARLNLTRKERGDSVKREEAAHTAISDYLQAFASFAGTYRTRTEKLNREELEEHVLAWLDKVDHTLEVYEADLTRWPIPVNRQGGSVLVMATVNDRGQGSFVVDTGASLVTLSEVMAQRLRLDYRNGRTLQLRLADGSRVEGHHVVLRSLAVGDAREENVDAVVIPRPPSPGVDGLLGMSFLGNFVVNLDGAGGELVLRRFEPR